MSLPIRYEILPGLPPYGPMYVPISEDGRPFASEGFVVRIYRNDGTSWVANCAPGVTDFSGVFPLIATEQIVVIAGGAGYFLHSGQPTPTQCFGINIRGIVPNASQRLIFYTDTEVEVIEPDGTLWISERIGYDGLKDLSCQDDMVSGLVFDVLQTGNGVEGWEDVWESFTLNLITREVQGGPFAKRPD